jgi:DNA-binding response OmpR family regulator
MDTMVTRSFSFLSPFSSSGTHNLRRERILIVDDDTDVAYSIRVMLETHGYYADVYTSPKQALSEFKPNYYHLILLDVRMPQMNGFELCEKLVLLDKECKVCFITASETYYESLKEFYPKLDVRCFIKKPVSRDELIKHVSLELSSITFS